MPETARVTTPKPEPKVEKAASENQTLEARPHHSGLPAQMLFQQRTLGNRAVQRLVKSGSLPIPPRSTTKPPGSRLEPGAATASQAVESNSLETDSLNPHSAARLIQIPRAADSAESTTPPTAQRSASGPSPNAGTQHIHRAWYNFSIPFTDYEFDPSWSGVKTAAGLAKDAAVEAFEWVVDKIKGLVSEAVDWLTDKWHDLQDLLSSALDKAKAALGDILRFVTSPLSFLANAIMSLDGKAVENAWYRFSAIITSIANGFKAAADALLEPANKLWGIINRFATKTLDTIGWLFNKLPSVLRDKANAFIDKLKSLWKSINDWWNEHFTKLKAWVEGAIDKVFSFVRKVLSFGINVVVNGIILFGQVVLFLKDLFSNPGKYLAILAQKSVKAFEGVESRFAGVIRQYFGSPAKAEPATASPTTVQRQPAPTAAAEPKTSATWGEIGDGILAMMGKKWNEFKSNPLSIVTGLLKDMIFPILGDIQDVIKLFQDIKKIVTGPLSAGSLEELWTSILQILQIPVLIYQTVVSILMRTLMIPLIVATFIPHPLVKAIAAAVGEALLVEFVQAELLTIGLNVTLLKTGKTVQSQKEDAYNRVADSLIALAMTAVIILIMLILHFIANIMKGIYGFIKGKVFRIEAKPIEAKGRTPEEVKGKGSDDVKPADPKTQGIPSEDGQRRIRINDEGKCEICASPCDDIRKKYGSIINSEQEAKIKAIEDDATLSDAQKEEKLKPIDQELADSLKEKAASVKGPYSNLTDKTKVEAGREFQPQQKTKILAQNAENNGGVLRSDDPADPWYGKELVAPPKGPFEPGKFPTVPDNQAQVDHIIPRKGPDGKPLGSNSYSNAKVVSAEYNNAKRNKL